MDLAAFFLVLAVMLLAAKLFGEIAERIAQPAVLGELLAGVVLGPSLMGIVPVDGHAAELLHVIAELGVLLLLFEIGLETDLRALFRVGGTALAVAAVGVVLPFALGYLLWTYGPSFGGGESDRAATAVFIGAMLTATSVGITARVLADLGQLGTVEAKIILAAAVIDDVLGLVILTVVTGIAEGAGVSVAGIGRTLGVAVGFLAAAVVVGGVLVPRVFNHAERMRVRGVLVALAVALALGLAALAQLSGSALILGAFAAGVVLCGSRPHEIIVREVKPVAHVFTPIFFVSVGASVNLGLLHPVREGATSLLLLATVLTALAVVGKVLAGWAAPWAQYRRLVVGTGMVPRGEVGLIFADVGLRSGLLSEAVFSAVLLMVMATTFVTPPALKALFARPPAG